MHFQPPANQALRQPVLMTHNTLVKNELGKKLYVRSKASFKNENTKKKKCSWEDLSFPAVLAKRAQPSWCWASKLCAHILARTDTSPLTLQCSIFICCSHTIFILFAMSLLSLPKHFFKFTFKQSVFKVHRYHPKSVYKPHWGVQTTLCVLGWVLQRQSLWQGFEYSL